MHKKHLSGNYSEALNTHSGNAHSTCRRLQSSSDDLRVISKPTELTRWKNLQRNGRYQNRHLENPNKRSV
jgi:hypothetical protein